MNTGSEKTEEEIAESVADALTAIGFSASSQDTGGGICCVVLERKDGGEIIWGGDRRLQLGCFRSRF